jgi:hypothetical protein
MVVLIRKGVLFTQNKKERKKKNSHLTLRVKVSTALQSKGKIEERDLISK